MGAGANVGSFGAGFAKSLTGVLLADRDRKQKEESKRKDQAFQLKLGLLPQAIENMEDPNDLQELLGGMFPDHFGEPGKPIKGKAGQPTPMDQVGNILKHFRPRLMGSGGEPAPSESGIGVPLSGMPSGAGEQMSDGSPAPTAPVATDAAKQAERKSFFGIPLMSAEEKAAKAAKAKVGATGASLEAMEQLAQRVFANGGAKTIEQARAMVGIPRTAPIELNAGAQLRDPFTYETVATGQPSANSGAYNDQRMMGVLEGEPRSKARAFFVDPRTHEITEQDGTKVTGRVVQVPDAPLAPSVIVTPDWQGVVDRRNATARPILGPDGQPILPRPTATAQERQASRDTAVRSIGTIKSIGDSVITKIGPAQRADAAKRGVAAVFGKDPNFRTYQDARLALAGNLAVLQQGSRPSDADIKAIWLPMIPDVFADTSESAALKWRVITVMSGVDPAEVANAAAAFTRGDDQKPGANKQGGAAGGVTPKASTPAAAGTPNAGAAATRLKARQLLLSKGKAADEAAINVFLSKPQNVEALQSWQPGQ